MSKLGFLKVETFINGNIDDVLLNFTLDNKQFRKVRMINVGNKHYIGVMPNNRNNGVRYFIEVFGASGNKIRDPISKTYIASIPFKAMRKLIPEN